MTQCKYFPGIKVTKNGDFYYLEEGHMRMKWDDGDEWHLTMEEEVTAESTSNIKGICGNYNGDPWGECVPNQSMDFSMNGSYKI